MDSYQKIFNVHIPIDNFDEQLENWLLVQTNQETLDRYISIRNLHESLVKQADECGDRVVIWHQDGDQKFWEIKWKSHDVHMKYMFQIPLEDRQFYEKAWDDFRSYLRNKIPN